MVSEESGLERSSENEEQKGAFERDRFSSLRSIQPGRVRQVLFVK